MISVTKTQTYWVLVFCAVGLWSGFLTIVYGTYIEPEKWEPQITEPSVVVVTPLDSPNPCWDPNFWSKIE